MSKRAGKCILTVLLGVQLRKKKDPQDNVTGIGILFITPYNIDIPYSLSLSKDVPLIQRNKKQSLFV